MLDQPGPATSGKSAAVKIIEDSSDKIRVDVSSAGSGYLVVADAIQSGWVAHIDDKRVAIVPADHALGAVRVGVGHHVVELSVAPRGWRTGEVITILGVLALALLLVVPPVLRRRRRPEAPPPSLHPERWRMTETTSLRPSHLGRGRV